MKPHTLQVLLDGYHLSILAKVFPCNVSLYSNIVRNKPNPLSYSWDVPFRSLMEHINDFFYKCVIRNKLVAAHCAEVIG